jgi:iron complex outermembrane receptor protein
VIAGLRYDINDDHASAPPTPSIAPATARPARSACSASMASRSTSSRSTIRRPTCSASTSRSATASPTRSSTRSRAEYRGEFFDGKLVVNAGLRAPFFKRDLLYNAFFFAPGTAAASPNPEKTDNFDVGVRYRSPKVQAQLGAFFNRYTDRTASAFDPELNVNTFRNLGKVDKYGIDGYVSYQPIKQLNVYLFGSALHSEIKDDLIIGECTAAQVAGGFPGCTVVGAPIFVNTAGKRESGAAKYTFGATVRGTLGPVEIGITGKRTGPRNVFDTNDPVHAFVGAGAGVDTVVFGATTPAYWLVNLDARLSLKDYGLEKSYLQFNVYNLFDQFYVGGFTGGLNQTITRSNAGVITAYSAPPFVQIGAPRTISATLVVGF